MGPSKTWQVLRQAGNECGLGLEDTSLSLPATVFWRLLPQQTLVLKGRPSCIVPARHQGCRWCKGVGSQARSSTWEVVGNADSWASAWTCKWEWVQDKNLCFDRPAC